MRTSRNREMPVVIDGNLHATQPGTDRSGGRAGKGGRVDERGTPAARYVALRAILGKRRRRSRAPVVRMDVRIEIIRGMTRKAIALHRRPLPLAVSLMALGAVRERMHSSQRKARPSVNFERLHVVPPPRGMTTVATGAEPGLMWILVAHAAFSGHAPLLSMTAVAGNSFVSPGQREARSGVIEPLPFLSARHLPIRRRVAVAAIQALGDRAMAGFAGAPLAALRIFGERHPDDSGQADRDDTDDPPAAHRPPFLRACGLA